MLLRFLKLRFAIFITLLFSSIITYGQSQYELNVKREVLLNSMGIATLATGHILFGSLNNLTIEQVATLDRSQVNAFDRPATYNNSKSAKTASDILLFTSFAFPAIALTNSHMKQEAGTIGLMYVETLLVSHGISFFTKNITLRIRPFVYNEEVDLNEKLTKNAQYSFYSAHVSTVAAMSFMTAKLFNDNLSDSKLKPFIWISAATIPAVTGYFRVQAGKHFPTDVIAGYAIGALTGLVIPQLHKNKRLNKDRINLVPGLNGFYFSWKL